MRSLRECLLIEKSKYPTANYGLSRSDENLKKLRRVVKGYEKKIGDFTLNVKPYIKGELGTITGICCYENFLYAIFRENGATYFVEFEELNEEELEALVDAVAAGDVVKSAIPLSPEYAELIDNYNYNKFVSKR